MARPASAFAPPLAALVALIALAGCAPSPDATDDAPPARPPNVVLMMVDTLRADHLGAYGHDRPTSPNLDAFAQGAVLFEQARSQATCTFPSANSLLTSRYVNPFQGQEDGRMGIPESITSVAEIYKARGYTTAAVSASPIVRKSPTRFNPHGGFDRGMDLFVEACLWRSARCFVQELDKLMPQLAEPYFLYVHLMDPHGPYRPPKKTPFQFAQPYDGPDYILQGDPNPVANRIYKQKVDHGLTPRDIQHLVDLYDEEILFFDSRFPRLMKQLAGPSGPENLVFALVSDHGEEFLEHGHVKHCRTPYDTQNRTPLVLSYPGGPQGARISKAVENVDVVPTLLELSGIDPTGMGFDGRSLVALAEGREDASVGGYAFTNQSVWRSVTDGRFKLLFHGIQGRFELYDLVNDPGETENVLRQHPEVFRDLRRELYAWLEATDGGVGQSDGLAASQEAEERLRALGYIQ